MSGPPDIAKLLTGHRHGDLDAFAALVGQAERTWWPMAAAVAGSQRQMESLVRCCVVVMRRNLEQCPVEAPAFHTWARRLAREQGLEFLERAAQPGSDGEDDLSRLVAAAGLEDLQEDGITVVDGALSVPGRLGSLSGPDRALIALRYRQGRTLAVLAREAEDTPETTASSLCRLRYTLDWRPDAAPEPLIEDPGFARTVEEAIADRLGTDLRQRLITLHLSGQEALIALVVRQVRLHLVLEATCRPADADRTRRMAATVAFSPTAAFPDVGRDVSPVHQLSQQISIRPGGVKRRKAVIDRLAGQRDSIPSRPMRSPPSPRVTRQPSPARPASPRSVPPSLPPVQSAPLTTVARTGAEVGSSSRLSRILTVYQRRERITAFLLWGAAAVMAVVAWLVIARTAPHLETQTAPVASAGPALVQALQVAGPVEVVEGDGRRRALAIGARILPQQRIEQRETARCELAITNLGRVVASGDAVITLQEGEHDTTQVTLLRLERGTLAVDTAGANDGHSLMVVTPHGRLTGTAIEGTIRCEAGGMQVTMQGGWGRLAGLEDVRETPVIPGTRARVGSGLRATVEGQRHFVRGVALGGHAATIAGQRWVTMREAREQGLTSSGRPVRAATAIDDANLQTETRLMLAEGLIGTAADPGTVTIGQRLPYGLWEIDCWLAGDAPLALQDLRVVIDGRSTPVGLPQAGGLRWRHIGPFTAWVQTGVLDLRLQNLTGGGRVAGISFTRIEPAP